MKTVFGLEHQVSGLHYLNEQTTKTGLILFGLCKYVFGQNGSSITWHIPRWHTQGAACDEEYFTAPCCWICEQRIKNECITAQCSFPRFLGWLHEGAVKQDFVHCLTAFTSPQSFTFAGAGGDKSRCFSKFVVDLHISTKHNKSFDQLYVVQLMNKVKHGYFQIYRYATHLLQGIREFLTSVPDSPLHYYLHSEVQSRVSVLSLQFGVCSMSQQHHGCLETALLGHNVERAFSSFTEVVDVAAMLQQQTTHLDYIH